MAEQLSVPGCESTGRCCARKRRRRCIPGRDAPRIIRGAHGVVQMLGPPQGLLRTSDFDGCGMKESRRFAEARRPIRFGDWQPRTEGTGERCARCGPARRWTREGPCEFRLDAGSKTVPYSAPPYGCRSCRIGTAAVAGYREGLALPPRGFEAFGRGRRSRARIHHDWKPHIRRTVAVGQRSTVSHHQAGSKTYPGQKPAGEVRAGAAKGSDFVIGDFELAVEPGYSVMTGVAGMPGLAAGTTAMNTSRNKHFSCRALSWTAGGFRSGNRVAGLETAAKRERGLRMIESIQGSPRLMSTPSGRAVASTRRSRIGGRLA